MGKIKASFISKYSSSRKIVAWVKNVPYMDILCPVDMKAMYQSLHTVLHGPESNVSMNPYCAQWTLQLILKTAYCIQ